MRYRHDPFSDFFERLFDTFVERTVSTEIHRRAVAPEPHLWRPAMDVFETVDTFIVRVEVPGIVPEEDVHVSLERNLLKIRGRRRDRSNSKKEHYHLAEVNYGPFERVVVLPDAIDEEAIPTATYENGFLEIVIPKVPPPRVKEVVVQARPAHPVTLETDAISEADNPSSPRQEP